MRCKLALLVVSSVLILLSFVSAQGVPTQLEVPNSPPILTQNIPDVFIVVNGSAVNHFDLDDYFEDPNGDTIVFSYSSVSNMTITIDSENRVSFYPDPDYIGSQSMQFFAADTTTNVSSNVFNIVVGQDTQAPQWSSPSKNRVNVYQNYYVNFSTTWTDNLALSSFVFSINQGSGWVNSSATDFSGTSNVSLERVQISASASTIVYWRFYAVDESGNSNVTDVQNFTVQDLTSSGGGGSTTTGSSSGGGTGTVRFTDPDTGGDASASTFTVDPTTVVVTLRQGDVLTRVLRIQNSGTTILDISSFLEGLPGLLSLSESSVLLSPGESYDLLLDFTIPRDTMPDQYFGQVVLKSSKTIIVPVVVDVKKFDADIELTVNISDGTRFIRPGQVVSARITIENLGDVRESTADLYYAIKDFRGNVLESSNEEFILYSSYDDVKSLSFPNTNVEGEFIFYARVITSEDVDLDSDTFFVGARFQILYWARVLFYPAVVLLLLVVIFFLIILHERGKRKKKLLELYLLLNELRKLVKDGKTTEALAVYKKIKVTYGQRISKAFLSDSDKLRGELEKFSGLLSQSEKMQKEQEEKEKKEAEEAAKKSAEEKKEGEGDSEKSEEGESSDDEGKEEKSEEKSEEKKDGEENSEQSKDSEEKSAEQKGAESKDVQENSDDGKVEAKEEAEPEEKAEEKLDEKPKEEGQKLRDKSSEEKSEEPKPVEEKKDESSQEEKTPENKPKTEEAKVPEEKSPEVVSSNNPEPKLEEKEEKPQESTKSEGVKEESSPSDKPVEEKKGETPPDESKKEDKAAEQVSDSEKKVSGAS